MRTAGDGEEGGVWLSNLRDSIQEVGRGQGEWCTRIRMLNCRGLRWRWLVERKEVHIDMDLSGKPECRTTQEAPG